MVFGIAKCNCGATNGLVLGEGKFAGGWVCPDCLYDEIDRLNRKVKKLSQALVKIQDQGCIGCDVIATKALGRMPRASGRMPRASGKQK